MTRLRVMIDAAGAGREACDPAIAAADRPANGPGDTAAAGLLDLTAAERADALRAGGFEHYARRWAREQREVVTAVRQAAGRLVTAHLRQLEPQGPQQAAGAAELARRAAQAGEQLRRRRPAQAGAAGPEAADEESSC